ncbi:MAG TPA: NUDIX domain-containing protein [Bacillota bacterium]|nr:NUDIX domain-containing protein [Bacillota bacterium]
MGAERLRSDLPVTRYPSGWEGHVRALVTDIITVNESGTHVLLVWRGEKELEGNKWALIGGYVDPDRTVAETAKNETHEEAATRIGSLMLYKIVDDPRRRNEPNQNISAVCVNTIEDQTTYGELEVNDPDQGTTRARWFGRDELPSEAEMAFDHHKILTAYMTEPSNVYPMSVFMSA